MPSSPLDPIRRSRANPAALALAILAICCPVIAAPSAELEKTLEATVFLEVQRYFRSYDLSSTGTGFFIHRDGYILTNLHVVGSQVEVSDRGLMRHLDCTVTDIRAVIKPGTAQETVVVAKVVGTDTRHDLALLKVNHQPRHWLTPKPGLEVGLMDEIYIVGYPFGQLLTFERTDRMAVDRNPEPSVNFGRVTSVRRDEDQEIAAIQIDAAVNPGNSGGPMLNGDGDLVGVVYAKVGGGSQIGFAIPPEQVWRFFERQMVDITFTPPFVPIPRSTVRVEVAPGILSLEARRATVTTRCEGLEPVTTDMYREQDLWVADLDIPSVENEAEGTRFLISLRMEDERGRPLITRSFRLSAKIAARQKLSEDEDAAVTMETRSIISSHGISIHEFARREAESRASAEAAESGETLESPQRAAELEREHQELVQRGKDLYQVGRYDDAVTAFEAAMEIEPNDRKTWEYLELARKRVRAADEGSPGPPPEEVGTVRAAATRDHVPAVSTTAGEKDVEVTLFFDAPFSQGQIDLWLDDESLPPVVFEFKKDLRRRLRSKQTGTGRVEETFHLPSGRHRLRLALTEPELGVLGERTFTETFRPGSRWTLRVNLPGVEDAPTFFLVERR